MPFGVGALLLAITAAALVLVALLAGRAGPLVAHPPTQQPAPLPTMTRPAFTVPTLPSAQPATKSGSSGAWLEWVAVAIGALILILIVIWLIRMLRRPARIAAPPVGPQTAPTSLSALGWLEEEPEVDLTDGRSFDPHRAADDIIASWAATESVAAHLGLTRPPASTPTEFRQAATERFGDAPPPRATAEPDGDDLLGPAPIGGWSASAVLLRLYHRARFDTAALAPGAATAARGAARALIAQWRRESDEPAATAGIGDRRDREQRDGRPGDPRQGGER